MSAVSPIRFVCGCENGHLQDIEWRRIVHQNFRGQDTTGTGGPCREQMWLEDAGTSAEVPTTDPFDLERFVTTQAPAFETARDHLWDGE
jgi:hypothetical protein